MSNLFVSRRDFLRLSAIALGGIALRHKSRDFHFFQSGGLPEFPDSDRLGRVTRGKMEIRARPDQDSSLVGVLYEDAVVPWLRETVSKNPTLVFNNQRWVEIPDGFVYAPLLQPVRNNPNQPVSKLTDSSLGPGMWAEVTIPFVDVILENEPTSNSWVEARVNEGLPVRLYYKQVFWIDRIKPTDQGQILYRVNPNYYGGVDLLWADARAFRPLTPDDLNPINPQSEDKHILVDVSHQTLSCFEKEQEVYFCRVSSGAKFDMFGNIVDKWATPIGLHQVSRKYISLQMAGGTTGAGYDLPGIGWTTIFATGGVAIHSTFWHNNYGDMMSHGCVNVSPDDAQWIFRWVQPQVIADPGTVDVTVSGQAGTKVEVAEG